MCLVYLDWLCYTDSPVMLSVSHLQDKSKGDILLSITYHPEAGTLEVLTWEASHLKKQDLIGLPSKYKKFSIPSI